MTMMMMMMMMMMIKSNNDNTISLSPICMYVFCRRSGMHMFELLLYNIL